MPSASRVWPGYRTPTSRNSAPGRKSSTPARATGRAWSKEGRELVKPGVDLDPQEQEIERPRDRQHRPERDVHAEAHVGGLPVRGLGGHGPFDRENRTL